MRSIGRAGRENIYETGEEGGMEEGEWRRETKETGDRKRGIRVWWSTSYRNT